MTSTRVPRPTAKAQPGAATPGDAGPAAERLLRIQEAAAETGLTPRSIRYYEELGLLSPVARSDGSYRLYDPDDLERLRFIRGLRDDAGFSLAEIGQLLGDEQARVRNRAQFEAAHTNEERRPIVLDALARVDRQVATLEHKIERLEAMIAAARARQTHLRQHLDDIDAGREHTHDHADPATATGSR